MDHPPDLPGGGPQGAQLAIALDLVLDGDAEDALDHQAAPRQHQRPQHQHHGQDLPEVAAVVVPEIHVGEPWDGEVQVLRRLAVEGLDGFGRQGLVPGQVDVGQVPGGVVVRPPLQGGVGEDHGKLRPGRRLLAQDAGDHVGAGEAGGVQGDGIPQPGAVGVLGQPVGPQGHLMVPLRQAPLGQGHLVAEGVEKVLVLADLEEGGADGPRQAEEEGPQGHGDDHHPVAPLLALQAAAGEAPEDGAGGVFQGKCHGGAPLIPRSGRPRCGRSGGPAGRSPGCG